MLHTVYVLNQTQGSLSQEERGTCTSGVSEWGSGDYHLEEVEVDSSDIQGSGNYAWRRDVDEHIHSRINQPIATDYRLFQPRLSKAYRAKTSSNVID